MTSLVQHFAANPAGRDLIVGDVHGHFTKLQAALDAAGFDPARDRLFSVGDLVDRGPESPLALEWLDRPWFHAVRGNHEDMAIRWGRTSRQMDRLLYIQNGGGWNAGNPLEVSAAIADALLTLPLAIELETSAGLVGLVHADCPLGDWTAFVAALRDEALPRSRLRELANWAMWSRDRAMFGSWGEHVSGVHAVVVGHTPMLSPTWLANVLHIDTGAWRTALPFVLIDAAKLTPAAPRPSPFPHPEACP